MVGDKGKGGRGREIDTRKKLFSLNFSGLFKPVNLSAVEC
jgi:hypothetical protein